MDVGKNKSWQKETREKVQQHTTATEVVLVLHNVNNKEFWFRKNVRESE